MRRCTTQWGWYTIPENAWYTLSENGWYTISEIGWYTLGEIGHMIRPLAQVVV